MNELKTYLVNEIIKHLEQYEGVKTYGCDLAYTLFEGENVDGTYTYSTYKAKEWVKEYWDDIGEIVEEIKFSLGSENIPNVFDRVEAFQVMVIIEGASYILGKCKTIDKHWDKEIVLTKSTINKLKRELHGCNKSYEFYS